MTKEIPLTQGKFALVDAEDYERLSEYSWCYDVNGYAYRRKTTGYYESELISMHHEILEDIPTGMVVDHKNRNKLDNRKTNLRVTTQSNNSANSPPRKGTSKYKGVHWSKEYKRWVAKIEKEGKYYHLGLFDCEENAAISYNQKAKELYGEYAYLNKTTRSYIDESKERPSRKSSKYTGISRVKSTGRYRSIVRYEGEKPVHIGYFSKERHAVMARDIWMDKIEEMNFKGSVVAHG